MTWMFIAIAVIWYSMHTNAALSLESASKGQDYGIAYGQSLGEQLVSSNAPSVIKYGISGEGKFQGDFDIYTTTLSPNGFIGLPLGLDISPDAEIKNTTIIPVWRYQ